MEDKNIALLEKMYNSTIKCIRVSENINNADELKNNKLLYDIVISNLVVVYETENKIDQHIKDANSFVEWDKIDKLKRKVLSDYHELDYKTIWHILTDELPILKEKLDKILSIK